MKDIKDLKKAVVLAIVAVMIVSMSLPALADWNPGDDYKMHYPQLPDPYGVDVDWGHGALGDDWQCIETGNVDDIHFWISWFEDIPIDIPSINISIWSNNPQGISGWSEPLDLLWQRTFQPGEFVMRLYGTGDQQWMMPWGETIQQPHYGIYQINIVDIIDPFEQVEDEIYWLVIEMPWAPPYTVGWKTSIDWFMDHPVWMNMEWTMIDGIEFAFVITGEPSQVEREFGDAPEDGIAYPSLGVTGAFPTCKTCGTAGWIQHNNFGAYFGLTYDFETDGNAGLCPACFPTYDDDECFQDGDAGLMVPDPFTIDGAGVVVPCPNSMGTSLGNTCEWAQWGTNVDIQVHNWMPGHEPYVIGYVNVLMDWDQNGAWGGSSPCPGGGFAPEHVLVDFVIPIQYDGLLSALFPPDFQIGPNPGYVWTRFSITEQPVFADWNGEGSFEDGETEDYLLLIEEGGEWYWKEPYPNYAPHTPRGMPDFDQGQDKWQRIDPGPNGVIDSTVVPDDVYNADKNCIVPGPNCHLDSLATDDDVYAWAFCGPVAVANCFWWFDSKYADPTGSPGDGEDTFPLVEDYGVGDDHSSDNVPLLIERLASAMHTCENGTTDIHDMEAAIDEWFRDTGLEDMFEENTYYAPEFWFIEAEIERSQDVILLLGYYDFEGGEEKDQYQEICESCEHVGPLYWISWQEFVPTANSLSRVEVKIARTAGEPNNVPITMTIESPLGTVLTSKTLQWWEVPELPWCTAAWVSFDVPDIALIPGQSYYIVLTTTGLAYHWCGAWGDPYPPGASNFDDPPTSYWDWTFRTFYEYGECIREDGHYVTCAGVNSDAFRIAFSDPALDVMNPDGSDHNDTVNVSHDIYSVLLGCPCPGLPYQWWLPTYPSEYTYTIVEQAVVICPQPSVEVDKWVWDPDFQEWVEEIDANVGEQVSFKIEVHNNGGYDLTNIVVTDTLPVCLEYVNGSADPTPTSVDGNTITWNFSGPLSYCETITITFYAEVVSEGENINYVDVTAEAYPYPGDPVIVTDDDTAIVNGLPAGQSSVGIEKWVWDPLEGWVKYTEVSLGTTVRFKIDVHNDGELDLFDIVVTDFLPDCLEYADNAIPKEPDGIDPVPGGTILYWYFPGLLHYCEHIIIYFDAIAVSLGENINEVCVEADSAGGFVYDCSWATVFVNSGIPPEITNVAMMTSDPLDTDIGWENVTCTVRDPVTGIKMHYPQLPDPFGWDVLATYPVVLADDWMCTETGSVTDIHFWGSWLNDMDGWINGFWISIHEDIPDPDGPGPLYSMPGVELWAQYIPVFDVSPMGFSEQGWYDPLDWWQYPNHMMYYQYDIVDIPDPFIQEEGTIYWLNICADVDGPGYPDPPLWGWKTSIDHWNDDGVWSIFEPPYMWNELRDPMTGESLDLAFMITGEYDEVDEVKLVFVNDEDIITGIYPMIKAMIRASGNDYYCNVTVSPGDEYSYYVWANDTSGNQNTSSPQPFDLPMNEDVDMGGKVHFMDLIAVARKYNDVGPNGWCREDVDNGGKVHFMDLIAIARLYGETW